MSNKRTFFFKRSFEKRSTHGIEENRERDPDPKRVFKELEMSRVFEELLVNFPIEEAEQKLACQVSNEYSICFWRSYLQELMSYLEKMLEDPEQAQRIYLHMIDNLKNRSFLYLSCIPEDTEFSQNFHHYIDEFDRQESRCLFIGHKKRIASGVKKIFEQFFE